MRSSGLYGALIVKGASSVVSVGFHSFVRPAPRAFFRPHRIISIAVARHVLSLVEGGRDNVVELRQR
jgi:hypothetical protein